MRHQAIIIFMLQDTKGKCIVIKQQIRRPPTADPSTWNLMIDNDDSMWSTISQWPALKEARDETNYCSRYNTI